jgi:type I restriction enzyme S subunit
MLSAQNIRNGALSFADARLITEEDFEREARRTRVQPDDVLLSIVGSIGRSAVVRQGTPPFTLQRSVAVISPRGVDPRFLQLQLASPGIQRFFEENARGTAQKGVYLGALGELPVRVAPMAEQQRIVSRIEELFSEIDEGERALERVGQLVERYRQSVLKAAITGELAGEAGTPSDGWRYAPLGDMSTLVTSGSRGWSDFYADDGPIFIRAQNIKHDVLDLTDIAHVNLGGVREGLRTRVAKGDLLVTITGANVTKTAYVDADLSEAYVSQHVALIRVQDAALARYLYYWLISPANGRAQLLEAAYGAGKPGLSLKDLRDLVVPVPPPEQCVRIADMLAVEMSRLESIVAQRRAGVAAASTLRQSILKAAFSGQLVPQDPRDEPASALLARLAAQAVEAPAAPRRRGRPAGRRLSQPNPEVAE